MSKKRILLAIIFIFSFAFFHFYLDDFFTLTNLKGKLYLLKDLVEFRPILSGIYFLIFYIFLTAFALPGMSLFTIVAGYLFNFWLALFLVSVASSLGASISFLLARYLFKNYIENKFFSLVKKINENLEKNGGIYLLSLRLIPAVPFYLINIAMGVTKIRLSTFYFVSQLGMLPGTIIYLSIGEELSKINSIAEAESWWIFALLTLIGIFPLFLRKN